MDRISLAIAILLTLSCNRALHVRPAQQSDVQVLTRSDTGEKKLSPCYDPLSYTEHPYLNRMKYIRVNFHFMNSSDGRYNMPEEEVVDYIKGWIDTSNYFLVSNPQMNLPAGNNTPALPIPYRYVISPDPDMPGDDGIYYHIDDELSYAVKTGRERNISDRRLIKKYAIRDDSVLNIFIQTHHLDSIESRTYKPDVSGISLGSSIKMFGQWHKKPTIDHVRRITNHEIGHSLGLSHTWSGHDGCDDTPSHPNCWYRTEEPPCDTIVSNNMMDYNAYMKALTPCQIGKILMNFGREKSIQRNILIPQWCNLDTTANIIIQDSVRWSCAADLYGNLIIGRNATLEIGCRVSMPKGSSITIYPGGKLILMPDAKLHNSCGDKWDGIQLIIEKKVTGELFLMHGALIENAEQPLGFNTSTTP